MPGYSKSCMLGCSEWFRGGGGGLQPQIRPWVHSLSPLLHGEGPGTHCVRMLYFPREFGFYCKICSIVICHCENFLCLLTSVFITNDCVHRFRWQVAIGDCWRQDLWYIQGSRSSWIVSCRVWEGPGDETRWIQVFHRLKQWMILLSTWQDAFLYMLLRETFWFRVCTLYMVYTYTMHVVVLF